MAPAQVSQKRKRAGPTQSQSHSRKARDLKRQTEDSEIATLEEQAINFVKPDDFSKFEQLPISSRTQRGLKKAGFTDMTDIQAKTLPLSLKGKDVLGAARTGSGKTLSFLVPILEILYRQKWGPSDGLGALIISPTRELAIQIFEVLRKIGPYHTFSAGLVIGGKDLKQEMDRLSRMNVLVATPGRLLQHMDQTLGFEPGNVKVLVLDEADRILDMGFSRTLNAIVENLPKQRQTMLFSATQTKRVKDLARLSLKDPEYVAVREAEHEGSTPSNLEQHYMLVELDKKLDLLYSFIRTHTKSKILVFISSCRQVQFVHETFCKLRPGISLMTLHGKQKQAKRLQIFTDFTKTQHALLFATDIAARGLDFPAVDWVVQVDVPEDAETYIHRVGRTARYNAKGNSLLFVLPSEEKGVLEMLAAKNIPVGRIKPKESKTQSIQNQLQSFAFQDPQIKYLAQKAFVSYVRSVYLQKNKDIFDVTALPLEKYAAAFGLPGAPKVKFVKEAQKAKKAEAYRAVKEAAAATAAGGSDGDDKDNANASSADKNKVRTKYDRMFERKNQDILSEHYAKLIAKDEAGSSEDEDDSSSGSDSEADDGSGSDSDRETTRYAKVRTTKRIDKLVGGDSSESDSSEDDDDDSAKRNSSHHQSGRNDDDSDDFLTLKRVDHDLDDGNSNQLDSIENSIALDAADNMSKRKLTMGQSKKAMALAGKRGVGEKLVFDEEGKAHAIYELKDEEDFKKQGDAKTQAYMWEQEEREKLQQADIADKELAKEKRREKKTRQKERERAERGEDVNDSENDDQAEGHVVLAPVDDRSDGYETPEFDLATESEDGSSDDESEQQQRQPSKKQKRADSADHRPAKKEKAKSKLEQKEELALRLLSGNV